jgi:gluconokinase
VAVIVVVIVAGVAGSGKTTVGQDIARRLGWTFADGDSMHPMANIAKMTAGEPLTDADRAPWLRAIAAWIDDRTRLSQPGVLACSALKRRYREQLLTGRPPVRMAFLQVQRDVAERRLMARHGHFFDPHLLASQFADLEPPDPAEAAVVTVPTRGDPDKIADEIIAVLALDGPG